MAAPRMKSDAERFVYHATPRANLEQIRKRGLRPGGDGLTYFGETPEDALKFMMFRSDAGQISVIKLYRRDIADLHESFDHNPEFFRCRVWATGLTIHRDRFVEEVHYKRA